MHGYAGNGSDIRCGLADGAANASVDQLQAAVENAPPGLFTDGVRDNLYHTRFKDGSRLVLNYGSEPKIVEGQTLEPYRILEVPAPRTSN